MVSIYTTKSMALAKAMLTAFDVDPTIAETIGKDVGHGVAYDVVQLDGMWNVRVRSFSTLPADTVRKILAIAQAVEIGYLVVDTDSKAQ